MVAPDRLPSRGRGPSDGASRRSVGRGAASLVLLVVVVAGVLACGAAATEQSAQSGEAVDDDNVTALYRGEVVDGPETVTDLAGTPDGGLLGLTFAPRANESTVLRLNASAGVVENRTVAGSLQSVQRVTESAYAAVGTRGDDVLVAWIREDGVVEWTETYGGDGLEMATDVTAAPGGDAYVLASTESFGAETSDLWVLRVGPDGGVVWDRQVDHEKWAAFPVGQRLPDGSLVATIRTERSMDGSVDGNQNISAARIAPNGSVLWRTRFTGGERPVDKDETFEVLPAHGEGVLVFGHSNSGNERWQPDFWTTRLAADGEVRWQRRYDTPSRESASAAVRTEDGYLLAGFSKSGEDAPASGRLVAIEEDGTERFTKTFDRLPNFSTWIVGVDWTADGRLAAGGTTFNPEQRQSRAWVVDLTAAVAPVEAGPPPRESRQRAPGDAEPTATTTVTAANTTTSTDTGTGAGATGSTDGIVLYVAATLSFVALFAPYGVRYARRQ